MSHGGHFHRGQHFPQCLLPLPLILLVFLSLSLSPSLCPNQGEQTKCPVRQSNVELPRVAGTYIFPSISLCLPLSLSLSTKVTPVGFSMTIPSSDPPCKRGSNYKINAKWVQSFSHSNCSLPTASNQKALVEAGKLTQILVQDILLVSFPTV